jgi:pyruvate kinase
VAAVQMMDRIAREAEGYLAEHPPAWDWTRLNPSHEVQDAIGHAAFQLYQELDAAAIVAFSATGGTGLFLSKSRPFAPLLVFTGDASALRRMQLFWGIRPVLHAELSNREDLLAAAREYLIDHDLAEPGRPVLLVAGTHFGQVGSTDSIEVATL